MMASTRRIKRVSFYDFSMEMMSTGLREGGEEYILYVF